MSLSETFEQAEVTGRPLGNGEWEINEAGKLELWIERPTGYNGYCLIAPNGIPLEFVRRI
jgi:hypothetical protein